MQTQNMRDRHMGRDWHDSRVAEAESAARVLGPRRAFLPLHVRVAGWIKTAAVLATFAGIGLLLAWRG